MSHLRLALTVACRVVVVLALTALSARAQQQSVKQRLCIRQMNKACEVVAEAQGHANRLCVRLAGKGLVSDVDLCVATDPSGKVPHKKQTTIRRENSRCLRTPEQNPDFGKTDATTVNDAAQGEEINLFESVMGSPAQPAIINCDGDPLGCKCQQRVTLFYGKVIFRKIEGFLLCKKPGLRQGTIVSNAGLENCMGADPRGKVASKLGRLQKEIQKRCIDRGVNLGTAFPGSCSSAPDLKACLDARTNCYACRMLNAADGLSKDCDLFDDGLANGSCPP